ncbi:MAG: FG-GAP repeat protein [Elusimicrobia bacterium]|nr:FG-GAP repeat protein [Elusimicrobiota bacterium]
MRPGSLLLVVLATIFSPCLALTESFGFQDADVVIAAPERVVTSMDMVADGDFDGDGFSDVAVFQQFLFTLSVDLIFGGDLPTTNSLSALRRMVLIPPDALPGHSVLGTVFFADLNGDHRDDLVLPLYYSRSKTPKIFVVFGTTNPASLINLNLTSADLEINMTSFSAPLSLGRGDFNGDHIQDLLVGDGPHNVVYLLYGKEIFPDQTFTLDDGVSALRFQKASGNFGQHVVGGDVDGDSVSDLIISAPEESGGATNAGAVYVLYGKSDLPLLTDMDVRPANVKITGPSLGKLMCRSSGDTNGDGFDELVVQEVTLEGKKISILDGYSLANGPPTLAMNGGFPGTPPVVFSLPAPWWVDGIVSPIGDFDGDGKGDVFPMDSSHVRGLLSTGFVGPSTSWTESFRFFLPNRVSVGDFNGDNKKDLVVGALNGNTWALAVLKGYRPLENPSILVSPRTPDQVVVQLTLTVDGEPAEMKLTGDLLVPIPGIWIPYQSKMDVTLTPSVGNKSITAVFRTREGRESESLSISIPLILGEKRVSFTTNLLKAGGRAQWEVHLDSAGHLKASVYSREGRLLCVIIDEAKPQGVYAFEWDGTNSEGQRVAPGIYTIVFDVGGRIDRARVLVK